MSLLRKLFACSKSSTAGLSFEADPGLEAKPCEADTKSDTDSSKSETECAVCQDNLTQPCTVPCGNQHVFCLPCLKALVAHNTYHTYFPCPLCRKRVRIPIGGVSAFRDNKTLRQKLRSKFPALRPRPQPRRRRSGSSRRSSDYVSVSIPVSLPMLRYNDDLEVDILMTLYAQREHQRFVENRLEQIGNINNQDGQDSSDPEPEHREIQGEGRLTVDELYGAVDLEELDMTVVLQIIADMEENERRRAVSMTGGSEGGRPRETVTSNGPFPTREVTVTAERSEVETASLPTSDTSLHRSDTDLHRSQSMDAWDSSLDNGDAPSKELRRSESLDAWDSSLDNGDAPSKDLRRSESLDAWDSSLDNCDAPSPSPEAIRAERSSSITDTDDFTLQTSDSVCAISQSSKLGHAMSQNSESVQMIPSHSEASHVTSWYSKTSHTRSRSAEADNVSLMNSEIGRTSPVIGEMFYSSSSLNGHTAPRNPDTVHARSRSLDADQVVSQRSCKNNVWKENQARSRKSRTPPPSPPSPPGPPPRRNTLSSPLFGSSPLFANLQSPGPGNASQRTSPEYGSQRTSPEYGSQRTSPEYGSQKTSPEYGSHSKRTNPGNWGSSYPMMPRPRKGSFKMAIAAGQIPAGEINPQVFSSHDPLSQASGCAADHANAKTSFPVQKTLHLQTGIDVRANIQSNHKNSESIPGPTHHDHVSPDGLSRDNACEMSDCIQVGEEQVLSRMNSRDRRSYPQQKQMKHIGKRRALMFKHGHNHEKPNWDDLTLHEFHMDNSTSEHESPSVTSANTPGASISQLTNSSCVVHARSQARKNKSGDTTATNSSVTPSNVQSRLQEKTKPCLNDFQKSTPKPRRATTCGVDFEQRPTSITQAMSTMNESGDSEEWIRRIRGLQRRIISQTCNRSGDGNIDGAIGFTGNSSSHITQKNSMYPASHRAQGHVNLSDHGTQRNAANRTSHGNQSHVNLSGRDIQGHTLSSLNHGNPAYLNTPDNGFQGHTLSPNHSGHSVIPSNRDTQGHTRSPSNHGNPAHGNTPDHASQGHTRNPSNHGNPAHGNTPDHASHGHTLSPSKHPEHSMNPSVRGDQGHAVNPPVHSLLQTHKAHVLSGETQNNFLDVIHV